MNMTKHGQWGLALALLGASSPAWADILPPDEGACLSKMAGDPCAFDAGPGVPAASACPSACGCANSTCTQFFVYLQCDGGADGGDAGPEVGDAGPALGPCVLVDAAITHACLVCKAMMLDLDAADGDVVQMPIGEGGSDADATVLPVADGGIEDADATTPPVRDGGGADADATAATVDAGGLPPADATAEAGEGPAEGGATGGGSSGGGGCDCSIRPVQAVRTVAPWLLAALVPLTLRRRRSRR